MKGSFNLKDSKKNFNNILPLDSNDDVNQQDTNDATSLVPDQNRDCKTEKKNHGTIPLEDITTTKKTEIGDSANRYMEKRLAQNSRQEFSSNQEGTNNQLKNAYTHNAG